MPMLGGKTSGFKVPAHQAASVLNQAAAVQNTWYTILDTTKNVRLIYIIIQMDTADENLECRLTIDGETLAGAQTPATAATPYFLFISGNATTQYLTSSSTRTLAGYAAYLEGRSVKVEVRKTSANGANALKGNVIYQKW